VEPRNPTHRPQLLIINHLEVEAHDDGRRDRVILPVVSRLSGLGEPDGLDGRQIRPGAGV
jgi:hypothetical protein